MLVNDSDPDATNLLNVTGIDTSGTLGVVIDNGDGTFTYDPNGAFESLNFGATANDSFGYTIADGNGGTAFATVSISITGITDGAPVAVAGGPYQVDEGSVLQLDGRGSSDSDGTIALYEWDLNFDGTTFTSDVTGSRPDFDASALDGDLTRTIVLRVTDDQGLVGLLSSTTVSVLNVAPTIDLSGSIINDEGTEYILTLGAIDDPGPDTVTDYIVHWDASNTTTYTAAEIAADPNVTHVFDDNGAVNITVDLIDEDGTHVAAGSSSVNVRNVDPEITIDEASGSIVDNGTYASFSATGSFTDALGTLGQRQLTTVTELASSHWHSMQVRPSC